MLTVCTSEIGYRIEDKITENAPVATQTSLPRSFHTLHSCPSPVAAVFFFCSGEEDQLSELDSSVDAFYCSIFLVSSPCFFASSAMLLFLLSLLILFFFLLPTIISDKMVIIASIK